ncbi:MAG: acylneuraminate cytidylyltransferase family protein [Deltaproteobacteria bacterium]|nr:acylneuraminate cytidylyltransferase family protein [Deltaproteobacteria bacterium]
MKSICLIPARGGSKRLPRKNVIDFMGKPIIAYSIEAGLKSQLFERIVVSTDDDEIADIAVRFGAEAEFRPPHLGSDTAKVVDVCVDYLYKQSKLGHSYDVLCCLLATAPLRRAEDIAATHALIEPGLCEFSMAVTHYVHRPWAALKDIGGGILKPVWPELINLRSQELPTPLVDNGSTYCVAVEAFLQHRVFYGPTLRGYCMPYARSIDIDDAEDLQQARLNAAVLMK